MVKKLLVLMVTMAFALSANAQFEKDALQCNNLSGSHDSFAVGLGGRYYIEQNGVFLGANCKFVHAGKSYNDIMPGVEVGYAFFLSRTVTVEPAIYYDQSFKSHRDYSTIGLRLGVGIYL